MLINWRKNVFETKINSTKYDVTFWLAAAGVEKIGFDILHDAVHGLNFLHLRKCRNVVRRFSKQTFYGVWEFEIKLKFGSRLWSDLVGASTKCEIRVQLTDKGKKTFRFVEWFIKKLWFTIVSSNSPDFELPHCHQCQMSDNDHESVGGWNSSWEAVVEDNSRVVVVVELIDKADNVVVVVAVSSERRCGEVIRLDLHK